MRSASMAATVERQGGTEGPPKEDGGQHPREVHDDPSGDAQGEPSGHLSGVGTYFVEAVIAEHTCLPAARVLDGDSAWDPNRATVRVQSERPHSTWTTFGYLTKRPPSCMIVGRKRMDIALLVYQLLAYASPRNDSTT